MARTTCLLYHISGAAAQWKSEPSMINTLQNPIDSGFGPRSTAEEVLAGSDLSGTTALVTGGYSGLGLETVRALSRAGAKVLVPARRVDVAQATLGDLTGVTVVPMDLADIDSIRSAADDILAVTRTIDITILNAGIMVCPETRVGPGWEAQFAINHLGHFVLINRLRPALAAGGRVVVTSSGAHAITGIRWDDVHFKHGYDKWQAYGQSKTANALFAVHLDAVGREHGIRSFAVHPGSILTPLQRHMTKNEMASLGWIDAHGNPTDPSFKSPEQGAATQVWAATSPSLDQMGGLYCEDCNIAPVSRRDSEAGVKQHAIDPAEASRLWDYSAQLTSENAFR